MTHRCSAAPRFLDDGRFVHTVQLKSARVCVAQVGLNELPEIHQFLDGFYLSRIGIRILIGQHIALHDPPKEDHIGAEPCLQTSPGAGCTGAPSCTRCVCALCIQMWRA